MRPSARRPFYSEYAWASDLLIDHPIRRECAAIARWLTDRGVVPGRSLLDAGCGTGRYVLELARRGYVVHGIDLSPEMIAVARGRLGETTSASVEVGDLVSLPARRHDAILCRGVLNDLTEDAPRLKAFDRFAGALEPGGVLVLDVRDWDATASRKSLEPLFRKRVSTERGELTFTSVTALDPENRQLLVSERHELDAGGTVHAKGYHFVMRCWTRDEVAANLARCGFGDVAWFGAYDASVPPGATERLVAVATSA